MTRSYVYIANPWPNSEGAEVSLMSFCMFILRCYVCISVFSIMILFVVYRRPPKVAGDAIWNRM